MDYFRAFRQLGIGGTIIAHTRREEGETQPFGSVFWHNSFRATWNIKRAATSPDGCTVSLGAFPRKFNLAAHPTPAGITVTFDEPRVYFRRTDVASIDELAESLPLWQRIKAVVRAGPMTLTGIAEELGHHNVESLDRIVRKHKTMFTKAPALTTSRGSLSSKGGHREDRTTCPDNSGWLVGLSGRTTPSL